MVCDEADNMGSFMGSQEPGQEREYGQLYGDPAPSPSPEGRVGLSSERLEQSLRLFQQDHNTTTTTS